MKLNMMWIVLCNIGMVNAELLIMPVTLSAITKLAPRKFTSSLIGVYYVPLVLVQYLLVYLHLHFQTKTLPNYLI